MPQSSDAKTFIGAVTELDVGGDGPNSAQLEFSVAPLKRAGPPQTFVVPFGTEPQIFAAMAALLTAAYMAKMVVTVTYSPQRNATPIALGVKLSADSGETGTGRMGFT
jgi:hypothetical protein